MSGELPAEAFVSIAIPDGVVAADAESALRPWPTLAALGLAGGLVSHGSSHNTPLPHAALSVRGTAEKGGASLRQRGAPRDVVVDCCCGWQ